MEDETGKGRGRTTASKDVSGAANDQMTTAEARSWPAGMSRGTK